MRGYTPPVLTPAPRVACPILDTGPVPTVDGQRCAATPPTRSHRTTNTHPTTRRAGDTRYPRWTGTGARLHPSPILTHHQHPSHLPSFRRRNVTPDPERGPGPRGSGARLHPTRSHPTTNTHPTYRHSGEGTSPPTPSGGRDPGAPGRGYPPTPVLTPPPTPFPPVPSFRRRPGPRGNGARLNPTPFSPHHQHPSHHPSCRGSPVPTVDGHRCAATPHHQHPSHLPFRRRPGPRGSRGAATPPTRSHPTTNTHPPTRHSGEGRDPEAPVRGYPPNPFSPHHQHPSHLPSFRRRPGPRGTGARLPPKPILTPPSRCSLPHTRYGFVPAKTVTLSHFVVPGKPGTHGGRATVRGYATPARKPPPTHIPPPVVPAKAGTQGQRGAATPQPILTAPPTHTPPPVVPGTPGTHGGRAPGRGYPPTPFSPHHQHPSHHPSFRRRPGPRGSGARLHPTRS